MGSGKPKDQSEYEKISDTLMWFPRSSMDSSINLKFVVRLATRGTDGKRRSYHSESQHDLGDKYNDVSIGYTISRNYSYFFSLDDSKSYTSSVTIFPGDVFFIKDIMEYTLGLFSGSTSVFGDDGKGYLDIVKKDFEVPKYIPSIDGNKFISFEPIVFYQTDSLNDKGTFGVRMYYNSEDNFVDMNFHTFTSFYWIVTHTDMTSLAATMLNYVKTPPYGVNIGTWSAPKNTNFFDKA